MKPILRRGALAFVLGLGLSPAVALSSHDCSVKYQAAKTDGSLGDRKYSDFRKAECGATATAPTPATTASLVSAPAAPAPTTTARSAPSPTRMAPAPAPAGAARYPTAISPQYSSETAGKGRMHTCLDAYKTAKVAGTLGDVKWIQKGGGYYSACNAAMKG